MKEKFYRYEVITENGLFGLWNRESYSITDKEDNDIRKHIANGLPNPYSEKNSHEFIGLSCELFYFTEKGYKMFKEYLDKLSEKIYINVDTKILERDDSRITFYGESGLQACIRNDV